MTMLPLALPRVKSLFQARLHALLPTASIDQFLRDSAHEFRSRKLPPGLCVHLLLLQLLHQTALQGLRHLHTVSVTASAICQARAKLPLTLFYHLVEQVASVAPGAAEALFHGLEVVLLDATSVRTHDTSQLAARYGKHSNQRRITPGYPAPKLLCLMDYATGMIRRAILLPACRQEHMLLRRMLAHLRPGQIVVADRGLVSFAFICELLRIQAHACLRLPAKQLAKAQGHRRVVGNLGKNDRLVLWEKPERRTKAYSKKNHAGLESSLTLREITYPVEREGYRTRNITLITTLVDPGTYAGEDLAELYLRRWQIEVYFRDLKRAQGMNHLRPKSQAGVRRELLGHVLLYNLVRQVMQEAATRQNVAQQRISFLDALRLLRHAAEDAANGKLAVNPRRRRPGEPRRVKTRRSKYPPLNKPRSSYRQKSGKYAK